MNPYRFDNSEPDRRAYYLSELLTHSNNVAVTLCGINQMLYDDGSESLECWFRRCYQVLEVAHIGAWAIGRKWGGENWVDREAEESGGKSAALDEGLKLNLLYYAIADAAPELMDPSGCQINLDALNLATAKLSAAVFDTADVAAKLAQGAQKF